MFKDAYNSFNKICPCSECLVQLMCRDRYNICNIFSNFLNNHIVVMTPEAKVFKT